MCQVNNQLRRYIFKTSNGKIDLKLQNNLQCVMLTVSQKGTAGGL